MPDWRALQLILTASLSGTTPTTQINRTIGSRTYLVDVLVVSKQRIWKVPT
jgi:hypothetical protein